ncbi:YwqG family protein [Bacillus stercoris]|uniref:YwqG family protein n=1 Tax=Bacillus stercoris TaxID=2054641 RepID=UPI002DB7966D|nr:YwqG family protein [Bacillus stercoris]MEC3615419.1 YwqG family protein [Bacillus stercoris]
MNHLPEKMRPYRELLEKSAKEYVKLNVRKGKTGRYDSKIAGDPYFPKHETYPTDENGQPMKLLVQINFSHIPQLDGYPFSGILQFYISVHDDVYGLNFDDRCEQKDFRVIYFENIIENEDELVSDFSFIGTGECDFPILSEAAVEPVKSSEWVLPTDFQFEQYTGMETMEFFGQFGEDEEDVYNELAENGFGHKIGGYASFTQHDPREYAYKEHTIMLLQIDSDDDIDSMWGDVGIANFFITPDDLRKKDFSNVLYNWDCS